MLTRYDEGALHWVDLEEPSDDEVAGVAMTYNLSPSVVEELGRPGSQPRVDIFSHYIYLRLHFPIFSKLKNGKEDRSKELNVVLGSDFLITAHYEPVRPLFNAGKIIEITRSLGKTPPEDSSSRFFFGLMDKLYHTVEKELRELTGRLTTIEERVFEGKEREMVAELSKASRDLIDLRRDLRSHGPVLSTFASAFRKLFNHEHEFELESLRSRSDELILELDGNRELLADLRETTDSLLSTKTNEAIKILSVMGFIMFPLTLVAGIFGMDTIYTPILGSPNDFYVILGLMALVFAALWSYLSKKGWLS